jgi:hypothetical protein
MAATDRSRLREMGTPGEIMTLFFPPPEKSPPDFIATKSGNFFSLQSVARIVGIPYASVWSDYKGGAFRGCVNWIYDSRRVWIDEETLDRYARKHGVA